MVFIFPNLLQIKWNPAPEQGDIMQFLVCNNFVCMSTTRSKIIRLNLLTESIEGMQLRSPPVLFCVLTLA